MESSSGDLVIFWGVVLARFLLPLAIFRYPLPAILACLVLDAVDQTIFQIFTNLPLDDYQSYDKALDIYYLSLAYISTMRNWRNQSAFQISRFLFYYRLVGNLAFELTGIRALLMIFPNTFEYFFIFYELVRLRWDPVRLSKKALLVAAAAIWIVIKLPQEWWIHVAQLDMTDFIKTTIFGASLEDSWSSALAGRPWVLVVAALILAALVAVVWWVVTRKLPAAERKFQLAADPVASGTAARDQRVALSARARIFNSALLEKIVLVSVIGVIFAQILPGVRASNIQLVLATAVIIILNALLSHALAMRGKGWVSTGVEFLVMAVVNLCIVLAGYLLLPGSGGSLHLGNTLFFILLLTLLVTLYDRYRATYQTRWSLQRAETAAQPTETPL